MQDTTSFIHREVVDGFISGGVEEINQNTPDCIEVVGGF